MRPGHNGDLVDRHARLMAGWERVHATDPRSRDAMLTELHRADPTTALALRELLDEDDRLEARILRAGSPPRILFDLIEVDAETENDGESDEARHDLPDIAGFEVQRELGRGGFGVVYLARQLEPSRLVAIKILSGGAEGRGRLAREARVLARLDHLHIARLLDVRLLDGHDPDEAPRAAVAVVMEFVEGVPIDSFVRDRSLAPMEVIELGVQLCLAAAHAHERGIIHRDLKPSNVLVTEREGRPCIKVLDFGIARLTHCEGDEAEQPAAETIDGLVGTPAYMSPEQARGERDRVDARTDVYAIGAMLYELLAGRRVVQARGRPLLEQLRAAASPDFPALGRIAPACRGDVECIVHHALEIDPDQRYTSARQMLEDLQRLERHEPIAARPPSALYRTGKFIRRRRTALLIGAAIVALVAIAFGGVTRGIRLAQRERDERTAMLESSLSTLVAAVGMIESRPGTLAARSALLADVVDRVAPLAEAPDASARLLTDYAAALAHLGAIDLDRGEVEAARERFERALAIRRDLASAAPDDSLAQAGLSFALVRLGDARIGRGAVDEVRAYFEEAMAIDERQHALHPLERRHADDVAWGCERLALLALAQGDGAKHDELQKRRLEITRMLLERNPSDRYALHGHAAALHALGRRATDAHERSRTLNAALEAYRALRRADGMVRRPMLDLVEIQTDLALLNEGDAIDVRNARLAEAEEVALAVSAVEPEDSAPLVALWHVRLARFRITVQDGRLEEALACAAAARTMLLSSRLRPAIASLLVEFDIEVAPILRNAGRADEADDLIDETFALLETDWPDDDPFANLWLVRATLVAHSTRLWHVERLLERAEAIPPSAFDEPRRASQLAELRRRASEVTPGTRTTRFTDGEDAPRRGDQLPDS